MSLEAKIIYCAVGLAIVVPLGIMILRRMIRGEPFRKPTLGDMQMPPPSGPSVD